MHKILHLLKRNKVSCSNTSRWYLYGALKKKNLLWFGGRRGGSVLQKVTHQTVRDCACLSIWFQFNTDNQEEPSDLLDMTDDFSSNSVHPITFSQAPTILRKDKFSWIFRKMLLAIYHRTTEWVLCSLGWKGP